MMDVIVNYWAVLVSAVATMVVGSLWYGPLFGKMWMKMMGFTESSMKSMDMTPARAMTIALISSLVASYVIAHFIGLLGVASFADGGWQFAFWAWLGLVMPVVLGGWLWEGKPFKLLVLNAAHQLVNIVVVVAILSSWQ